LAKYKAFPCCGKLEIAARGVAPVIADATALIMVAVVFPKDKVGAVRRETAAL